MLIYRSLWEGCVLSPRVRICLSAKLLRKLMPHEFEIKMKDYAGSVKPEPDPCER